MCGIRRRRAPRRGPAGAAASAGETPPPGAASAQPGPPPAPAWALPLCTPLLFTFKPKGRERRERSMWLPSSDHKYCRKLQMAAPLPNSAHTASPNAMEMDPELAPVAALTTWIPFHAGRDQGGGSCTTLFPKRARPSARVPARVPERGEGWGRICGEGSGALLVQRSCAPSQDYAAPPLSSPAWLLPVLNDFCVLCLILPFTCSCSPSPQLPRLHSGMLRRPRVGAPLLSPRCNSHAAARFLFKQPTPPHPPSR